MVIGDSSAYFAVGPGGVIYVLANVANQAGTWYRLYACSVTAGACTLLIPDAPPVLGSFIVYVGGANSLFWTAAGNAVNYWNLGAATLGTFATVQAYALTTDGTYLYRISGSSIMRAHAQPAAETPTTVATGLTVTDLASPIPDTLATDGKNVFFGTTGPNGAGLYAVPVGGGSETLIAPPSTGTAAPTSVVSFGGWIYWYEGASTPVIRKLAAP
jgi:hypothetical protein